MINRITRHRFVFFSLLMVVATLPAFAAGSAVPTYVCQGFAEPIRLMMHIGRGRVLPLRGKLQLADGTFADDKTLKTPPAITVMYVPESGAPVDKTAGIEVRDYGKGNHFVFDAEAHWKLDLGTGNLPDDGKYTVTMGSGDEAEYKVDPQCTMTFMLGRE